MTESNNKRLQTLRKNRAISKVDFLRDKNDDTLTELLSLLQNSLMAPRLTFDHIFQKLISENRHHVLCALLELESKDLISIINNDEIYIHKKKFKKALRESQTFNTDIEVSEENSNKP